MNRRPLLLIVLTLRIGNLYADEIDFYPVVMNAQRIFLEAEQEEDREKAGRLYEEAATQLRSLYEVHGIKNHALFYNIGNIYTRAGKLGDGIFYYRLGELLRSTDKNLERNLDYARSLREDAIEPGQKSTILRVLFTWYRIIPLAVRHLLFAVFYVTGFSLLALKLFLRWGRKWILILSFFISAVFALTVCTDYMVSTGTGGVITAPEIDAKKGDSQRYESSFSRPLHQGTEFKLISERNGWYRIELENDAVCWIPAGSARLVRFD